MLQVELRLAPGAGGPDQGLLKVLKGLRRTHVLARRGVPARSRQALFVTIIEDRLSAGEHHQGVTKLAQLDELGVSGQGVVLTKKPAKPSDVVIAQKCLGGVNVAVKIGVGVISIPERHEDLTRPTPGHEIPHRVAEGKVKGGVQTRRRRPLAEKQGIPTEHLAELEKVRAAGLRRHCTHARSKPLPEFGVDVLDRVDPETCDSKRGDPAGIHIDEALHDLRAFGEHIIESRNVALEKILAGIGRVSPMMIKAEIVQPPGLLESRLPGADHGQIGETDPRFDGRKRGGHPHAIERQGALVKSLTGRRAIGVD